MTALPMTPTKQMIERLKECRPEVLSFALLMERELRANDHKPGWKHDTPEDLVPRVEQEARELRSAVDRLRRIVWVPRDRSCIDGWFRQNPQTGAPEMGDGYEDVPEPQRSERAAIVASEAADVANMAMMVADVCGALPTIETLTPSAGEGVEGVYREGWEDGYANANPPADQMSEQKIRSAVTFDWEQSASRAALTASPPNQPHPDIEGRAKIIVVDGSADRSEGDTAPRWEVFEPRGRTLAYCTRKEDADAIVKALTLPCAEIRREAE